jgi:hypothetical protein
MFFPAGRIVWWTGPRSLIGCCGHIVVDVLCLPDGKTEKNKTEPQQLPNNQSPMKGPACLVVVGTPFCFSRSSHRDAVSIETMSGSALGAGVGAGVEPEYAGGFRSLSRDGHGKQGFVEGVWGLGRSSLQPDSLQPDSLGACSLEPGKAGF